ncbi:BBE domain-containing protein [Streptomyces sp. BE147]|uniref:BBE domain-containing protein n=1 Tax=Streptomyces sp. BE147 TaxID=3002524 RepID=UPI003FA7CF5C
MISTVTCTGTPVAFPCPTGSATAPTSTAPDTGLADPEWNTSGVPWHTLYYKANYPRHQRVKSRWDPLNVFHHPLAVQPPAH